MFISLDITQASVGHNLKSII